MADIDGLIRLALAAVEHTADAQRLGSADTGETAPELGRERPR
jgi:hypothetical protein